MKITVFLFVFFVLCSFVYAANTPFQRTELTNAQICNIEYGGPTDWKTSQDREIYFHVINSTGAILTNNNAQCIVHLYGEGGDQVYVNNSVEFSAPFDWEVTIPKQYVSSGDNSLLIQCNSSVTGCFSVYPVYASAMGKGENETDGSTSYALFLILIPIFLVVLPQITRNNFKNELGFNVFRRICYILAASLFIVTVSGLWGLSANTHNDATTEIKLYFYLSTLLCIAVLFWSVYGFVIDVINQYNTGGDEDGD